MSKRTFGNRTLAKLLISTILAAGIAAPIFAQSAAAPEPVLNTDEHGVDLESGTYNIDMEEGNIGPAKGGVRMVRYYGQSGYRDNWSGDLRKTMEGATQVITISFGKISERFTNQAGVWVPAKANGATLNETVTNQEYSYKSAQGMTILYKSPLALNDPSVAITPIIDMPGAYCSNANATACAVPVENVDPDGSKYRLADVRSNSSYGMKIKYQSDVERTGTIQNPGPPPTGWFIRSGLKFMDLSQVFCDPNANNCDAVSGTWPTVTYATPAAGVFAITNDQAGTWRLDYTGGTFKIRRPGQTTDTTTVNYGSNGKVSSISDNGQTKSYV
jgi:hypothetical protein